MDKNKIEIVIVARDVASGVMNSIISATRQYRSTLDELNGTANQVTHAIRNMFLAIGGYSIFKEAISTGYRFNSMIEDSRAGIAGLIASMNEIRDATGNVVSAQEKFNAAMTIAERVQTRLRIEGLKTAATLEQLNKAFAQAYVPAKEAGLAEEQIVSFTARIVQAATMMKIPLDMLGEELRNILSGRMQPRTTLLMPLMESIGLTNEKIKELIASGKFFEEFMIRSEGVLRGAEAAAGNFSVRLSNLKDAIQQAFGRAFETGFERTKALIQEITDWIVQIDEKTGKITWNEDFINTLKKLDNLIFSIVDGIKSIIKGISDFIKNHPMLTDMILEFGKLIGIAMLVTTGLRTLGGMFIWLKVQCAANIAFITGLFGNWITTLNAVQVQAIATSGALTALGAAAGIVGAAFLGWNIGSWISQMELGKKTVGEWVQLGMIKLTEYLAFIKYIFQHIPILAQRAWAVIKLTFKQPFISEESYQQQLAEIEKTSQDKIKALNEGYKKNLAQSEIMKKMLEAEAQARKTQADTIDKAKNSMDGYTTSTNKGTKTLTEYVLRLRDVNNVLDRMADILDNAKKRTEELILETKKAGLPDKAAKYLDIAKEYEENLAKAREFAKDAERIVREANERLEKAREEAAKKNREREKKDPIYGIDPKVFKALKEAQEKQRQITEETNRITEAANQKRMAAIAKFDEEINREITEKNKTEIEKRIEEVKKWEKEIIDALNIRYADEEHAYNEYWAQREKVTKVANQAIQKINDEARQAELEAIARHNLAVLDMAEKEMSLPRVDITRARIQQYETLLHFYENIRKKAIEINDITARLTVEGKIDETRAKIIELRQSLEELTGSFTEGLQRGISEYLYYLKKTFQSAKDIAIETAQAMQQAFSDFFFDAFTGKLKSLGDYITSFLQGVSRAIANYMANMAVYGILGAIGLGSAPASAAGLSMRQRTYFRVDPGLISKGFHGGGIVGGESPTFYRLVPNFAFAGAPRFHSGFAPGEYPAILQQGEAVFTPGQLKALGNAISKTPDIDVQINIENNTGFNVQQKSVQTQWDGRRMVKNIILELLQTDKTLRDSLGAKI